MPFAAPIFSTVKTLTLAALLGAISAQAITIGAGYSSWNCTGPGSAVSGNVPGKNHVGYNSFISSYLIKSVCSAGERARGQDVKRVR